MRRSSASADLTAEDTASTAAAPTTTTKKPTADAENTATKPTADAANLFGDDSSDDDIGGSDYDASVTSDDAPPDHFMMLRG